MEGVQQAIDDMRDTAARRQINRLNRQSRQLRELVLQLVRKRAARKRQKTAAAAAAATFAPPSPAQRLALGLPEICRAIFAHLNSGAALAAAARMCHAWFAPAVQELWRQVPFEAGALAAVSGVRTLLYGAAVRELCVRDGSALGVWTFPAVRALRFYYHSAAGAAVVDAAYFSDVLDRCGGTLELVEVAEAEELADCRAPVHAKSPVKADHLGLLARRAGLRALHHRGYVRWEALMQAVAGVSSPFAALSELSLCLRSDAVQAMVTFVGGGASIALLVLRIVPVATAHHWRALSSMTGLRELCIVWDEEHSFTGEELLEFASLPRGLQKLLLLSPYAESPTVHQEHWLAVLSNLPKLVALRADVCGDYDGAILRIVGEQCRLIEYVQLQMPCLPWELEQTVEAVLFPHLRELHVDTTRRFDRLT
jgi:hypothetical protein